MAISKIDLVPDFFVGQGDIVIFDEVANWAVAKLSSLANPKSFGNIHMDSTSFTGESPTLTALRNEQGKSYYSTVEAGTFAFEFFVPSITPEMLTLLYGAEEVTDTFTAGGTFAVGSEVIGFMHETVALERPIMIVNDSKNKALIVPRAKIVAAPAIQDKATGSLVSVSASDIDTESLKTLMMVYGKVS